jgi:SPP1 gp7 family putative phage head morphogenesis protein
VQDITIGQVVRGNQTVQTWYQAVKAAESSRMPNRRSLYNTYLDVSIDLHLDSVMNKRTRALLTVPFVWEGLEDEAVLENFASPWFSELMKLIQSRVFWGTTLVEFQLGNDGLISDVELIPRQNVKPELGVIMTDGHTEGSTAIHYREGIYVNYVLEIGRKDDLGMLSKIAPYVIMKRANMSDFSRYNEMYGIDLRVYEYDPLKPGAREQMKKQAEDHGSAAYILIPKGYGQVTFPAVSNKQSSAFAYDKFNEIMNNEITIGVLGQLLTTGGDKGGSYELGKVHKAVQEEIAMEDRMVAEYIINYPMRKNILVPHGYPLADIKGKFKVPDQLPKENKANMWVMLAKAGLPIAEEDFYAEFGVPMPGDRDVITVSASPDQQTGEDPTSPNQPPPAKEKDPEKDKDLSAMVTTLRGYYGSTHEPQRLRGTITLGYKSELNEIVDSIIERVRKGELRPGDVDPELYELIGSRLYEAVERGFGATLESNKATEVNMLKALRENVYRFSGFKDYHFVKDANALLVDADGKLKDFGAFRRDVLALNQAYNVDFLRTEYNHAVAASRMAGKWVQFEADKGTLPLLQYITVGDGRVRLAHQPLDGVIKPVDDPLWNRYLPPNDWNCRCTVRQLADGEISAVKNSELPQLKKDFQVNYGKEQYVFPPTHPQFSVSPEDQATADKNFGLDLPG